jgi:glycosyltransferase involved in cell wall biosynthesis
MTTTAGGNEWRLKPEPEITVDVVIPVLNEAHVLEGSILALHRFFRERIPLSWRLVIAENGSSDGTAEIGRQLADTLSNVDCLLIGRRGRGRALRTAWTKSSADIVCYTDVDLSTELEAFPRLFRALIDGHDVAIGSRLARGSRTTRSLKREIISRLYNQILRLSLHVGFSDAQTGFKAVTREVVTRVLPLVKDESWFLDTELLVLCEKLGYRIADIPVRWIEDDDSRVKIISTAWEDLKGVARLRRTLREGLVLQQGADKPATALDGSLEPMTVAARSPLHPSGLASGRVTTFGAGSRTTS